MAFRGGALELGLRGFAEPLRLGLAQSGIEQFGEMLAERMDFGPRGLGLGPEDLGPEDWPGRIFGGRAWAEYGANRGGKRASAEALPLPIGSRLELAFVVNKLRYVIREGRLRQAANLSGDL